MKMIVVGCGRLGSGVAYRLYKNGHVVVVVDHDDLAFSNLPPDFRGRTVHGDALNAGVLDRAGIAEADGLAAVTSSDAMNAVISHIAKENFKVANVVSRNYDPHLFPLHKAFDLQIVSSAVWGSQRIEEMLYHGEVKTLYSAGNGEVEIYEILIPNTWDGKLMSELLPQGDAIAVALTRAGKAILPNTELQLQAGDRLQFSASLEGALSIRKKLESGEGE
ncbi:MAG: potassium channel family protein [Anaerolineales bacterium]|jgi:trk system potassium uptake protein TrkA